MKITSAHGVRKFAVMAVATIGAAFSMLGNEAQATPAFARATGAACNKCHTTAFPGLTYRGERFMRNGFQVRGEEGVSFEAPGEKKEEGFGEGKKLTSDLFLNNLSNLFSTYGVIDAVSKTTDSKTINVGVPETLAILATGTIYKDVPVFMELEYSPTEGAVEADHFFVGYTNIGGTTFANTRVGSIDPTTWTSFPSFNATGFVSAIPKIGAYAGADTGEEGFAEVGTGYSPRSSLEYYGYNDNFLFSAAVANSPESVEDKHNLDYWLVGRFDFMKGSSASILYYRSNSGVETNVWTFAGNLRLKFMELLAQYSHDTGTHDRDSVNGYTLQANIPARKNVLGVVRFDSTDNGAKDNSQESALSFGVVYAPVQNFKITSAIVTELQQAQNEAGDLHRSSRFNVNFQYAL